MSATSDRQSHHAGLDADRIVECAAAMVAAGGPEALSMRKLASELGVTPTTLYWHVGGRDDLVSAIVARQGERQADRAVRGDDARSRIVDAARHVWEAALDNRHVTRLAHQSGTTGLLELGLERALAVELQAAGLAGAEARDALRSILLCVGGFLVVALRDPDTVADGAAVTSLWAEVDEDRLDPATRQALTEPPDLEALLDVTLGAVVDRWVARAGR